MANELQPLLRRRHPKSWRTSLAYAFVAVLNLWILHKSIVSRPLNEYDVIIVGGGPAGSVLARVLSDDPSRRILLIEAGDATQSSLGGNKKLKNSKHTIFDIPYLWSEVAELSDFHWPIPDVLAAKGLGGCGIHNAMLYGTYCIVLIHK